MYQIINYSSNNSHFFFALNLNISKFELASAYPLPPFKHKIRPFIRYEQCSGYFDSTISLTGIKNSSSKFKTCEESRLFKKFLMLMNAMNDAIMLLSNVKKNILEIINLNHP